MPPMVRYLDEDGELLIDQPMSDELALEGYRVMLRGRRFDERSVSLQRQDGDRLADALAKLGVVPVLERL